MLTDIENPYASPSRKDEPAGLLGWRMVPAGALFLIGTVAFAFGLIAVVVMLYVSWLDQAKETLVNMMAGCGLYLGFGASWMLAGWYCSKGRYRRSVIATAVGILIPVILFAILGF
jgi:hypothetical protein